MSDEVVESSTQLRMLADDREIAGKTLRDFVAPRCGLANADLDSITVERVGLSGANLSNVRLEHAVLKSVDLTSATLEASLLHRVRAFDNTQLRSANLVGVELRRCELGPNLFMEGCDLTGSKIQATTFHAVSLSRAVLRNAVILRSSFVEYGNS